MTTNSQPPVSTAFIKLKHVGDPYVACRITVTIYDDLGFPEVRNVWEGSDWNKGEQALDVVRKTLGATGLHIVEGI